MASALRLACEKLRQKELERERRKECQRLIAEGLIFKKKVKQRPADKRLDKWQSYLRQRKILSERIMKKTGKTPGQILLNCSGVVEKAMIQRLLDQAERLSPENQWRKELVKQSTTRCGLECTLPDNNVVRNLFTVYGLPEISKQESNSTCCIQNWFRSKHISERFEKKKFDIFNIIDHYPDVENLQIIGTAMELHDPENTEDGGQGDTLQSQEQTMTQLQSARFAILNENQRRSVSGRKTRLSKSRKSKSK